MDSRRFEFSTVLWDDSPEMHKKVFDFLMENYFLKYEAFHGEVIMQNDECMISAPEVLSDIADEIVKFKFKANS